MTDYNLKRETVEIYDRNTHKWKILKQRIYHEPIKTLNERIVKFQVEVEELRRGQYIVPSSKYIGMVMGIDEDKVKKDEYGNVIDPRVLGKADKDYGSGELVNITV